jgi:XTP/dITP diphosphohydrolase
MLLLPNEILIATGNEGKFLEISDLLAKLNIAGISPRRFNLIEPEETAQTFEGNSLLKAKFYGQKTGLFSLADDSGLCVEALSGKPGIHSARFAINKKTGEKNFVQAFEKIFLQLKKNGVFPEQKPRAYFVCNLSLFNPKTNFSISFEGKIDGHLTFPAIGNKGFGYDPIFIKEGMNKTFGEIDAKQKDQISHRAVAFEKMTKWLQNQSL